MQKSQTGYTCDIWRKKQNTTLRTLWKIIHRFFPVRRHRHFLLGARCTWEIRVCGGSSFRVSPSNPAGPHSRTRARTLRAPVSTFRRDGTLDDSRQGHLGRQDHARRRAVDHGGSAEIDALGRGQGERPRAAAASHLQGTRAEGPQDSRQLRYARSRGPRRRRHRVSSRAAQIPRRGQSFDRRRSEKKRKCTRGRTAADRARRPRPPNPDAPRPIARSRAQVSSPNTPSTS